MLPLSKRVTFNTAHTFALIKPQFELEKKFISKGGVVKDEKLRSSVCENIRLWIEDKMSWKVIQIIKSPITGPKGNVEYLLYASK